jgi:hypothetical protein
VKLWKGFRVWFVGNVSSSIIFVSLPSLFVYLVVWFSIRELVVDNIIVSIGSEEHENNEEEYLLQMPEKCQMKWTRILNLLQLSKRKQSTRMSLINFRSYYVL